MRARLILLAGGMFFFNAVFVSGARAVDPAIEPVLLRVDRPVVVGDLTLTLLDVSDSR